MKKLKLELDELTVESFQTGDADAAAGTVHARQDCVTYSCAGTCGAPPPTDSTALYAKPTKVDLTLCLPCCA